MGNMRTQTTLVSLKHGTIRGSLSLRRCPKYLRFVITGTDWKTLDALDQLDDEPRDGEYLIAAVKSSEGSVHLDGTRNGRRFGEWHRTATYETMPDQPSQETMRDRAEWQKWCMEREAND